MENIIVPYDFTEKADCAVKHAAVIARNMKAEVVLLHIVKKESQSPEAIQALDGVVAQVAQDENVACRHIVKEGSIFTTINEVVAEQNSTLVVMGTHGMKGMQKITGSWASRSSSDATSLISSSRKTLYTTPLSESSSPSTTSSRPKRNSNGCPYSAISASSKSYSSASKATVLCSTTRPAPT